MRLVAAVLVAPALLGVPVSAWSAGSPSTVTCESVIDPGRSVTWKPRRVVLGVVAVPAVYIPQTVATGQTRWPWSPYVGGFLLKVRAACWPLTFTVAGRRAIVRFGVGKRCA